MGDILLLKQPLLLVHPNNNGRRGKGANLKKSSSNRLVFLFLEVLCLLLLKYASNRRQEQFGPTQRKNKNNIPVRLEVKLVTVVRGAVAINILYI
jgi:hypothetical protein